MNRISDDEILRLMGDGNVSDLDLEDLDVDDEIEDICDLEQMDTEDPSSHLPTVGSLLPGTHNLSPIASTSTAAIEAELLLSPPHMPPLPPTLVTPPRKTRQNVPQLQPLRWKRSSRTFISRKLKGVEHLQEPDTEPSKRENWTAYKYFKNYLPDSIYNTIASMTNVKAIILKGVPLKLTETDIKTFIGSNIMMSCYGYPRLKSFWATKTRVSCIADNISRNKFFTIRSCLKIVSDADINEEQKKSDKLWKVRPFLEEIRKGCLKLERRPQCSIDEQMIPFTGRTKLKQYVRGKPHPVGIKNYILASSSGLILDFEIYQGKNTTLGMVSNLTVAESVIARLTETVPPGASVYFDRFFTTERVFSVLNRRKIRGTGTCQRNHIPRQARMIFTSEKVFSKLPRGSSEQIIRADGNICAVRWLDNKIISLLSTENGIEEMDECRRWSKSTKKKIMIPRPIIIKKYNMYMGGVDLTDRLIALYRCNARTNRWTLRIILHFVDVACVNSWLLYREDRRALKMPSNNIMQLFDFRVQLAHELLSIPAISDDSSENEEPSDVKVYQPLPSIEYRQHKAEHIANMSEQKFGSKCRLPGCKKKTKMYCVKCKMFLCITAQRNCFAEFHGVKVK